MKMPAFSKEKRFHNQEQKTKSKSIYLTITENLFLIKRNSLKNQ